MRCMLTFLLGCSILLGGRDANADAFLFTLDVDSGGGFVFDGTSFRIEAPFSAALGGESVQGNVSITAGPLLNLDLFFDEGTLHSLYTYGSGEVSMTADWTCGGAQFPCDLPLPPNGSFAATIEGLTISVCEGCGGLFPSSGAVAGTLGPGLFDPALAFLLGISGPSIGGFFSLPADDIEGDASSPLRVGASSSGQASLVVEAPVVDVPEPSLTLLLLATVGASSMWRRRRRVGRP